MSINPNYMIAPSLQSYFVNKSTGLPLTAGIVNFYSDINRSIPKVVYTISGSAPNYTYTSLGASITLSGVGTVQDGSGNDILIYYYPFDDDGNVELYYIEVFDSENVPQFTRQAFPNIISESSDLQSLNIINYIPNGQFLAHNDIPENKLNNIIAGQITLATTFIAPGGWNFARSATSTANDNVLFFRYGSFVTNPSASPRYAVICQCFNPDNTDTFKGLRIRFSDVNKFASDTQEYTFAFSAATYNSANFQILVEEIKYFGTGGIVSPPVNQALNVFTLNGTQTIYKVTFTFGNNLGKQIGTNNDDYVELSISFPTNAAFGAQLTDFMLLGGSVVVTGFPTQTNADFMARSLTAPPPDYAGFDLGLPLILTQKGLDYFDSLVGVILPYSSATAPSGFLTCDGAGSFYTNGYFSDGVPMRRLYNVLYNGNNYGMPVFGTGTSYVTCMPFNTPVSSLMIATNTPGIQTQTADGTTGFTFTTNVLGNIPTYGVFAYVYGSADKFWIVNSGVGAVIGSNGPGTSGFSVHTNATIDPNVGERVGTANAYQILTVSIPAPPAAGTYFQFSTPTDQYYVWFRVGGVGIDPAPGGTGIRIDTVPSNNRFDVAFLIAQALSSHQVSTVSGIPQGSSITPNSYFNFYANSKRYYVWFNLNGSGTDPSIAGAIGIPVVYNTSYTQTQMLIAVVSAINSQYFTTPNLNGVYIKGYDPATTPFQDYNLGFRYAKNSFTFNSLALSQYIGGYGFSQILNHSHDMAPLGVSGLTGGSFNIVRNLNNTGLFTGVAQSDVESISLNYIIKY